MSGDELAQHYHAVVAEGLGETTYHQVITLRNIPPEEIPSVISRRVWLGDLPENTTFRQILCAVRGELGVVEVTKAVINAPISHGVHARVCVASVVFATMESAKHFIEFTKTYAILLAPNDNKSLAEKRMTDLRIRDRPSQMPELDGLAYAYPIADQQNNRSISENTFLALGQRKDQERPSTRVIKITDVPITAVWFLLSTLGLRKIVHATYSQHWLYLWVEFVSVVAASNAVSRLTSYAVPYMPAVCEVGEDNKEKEEQCLFGLKAFVSYCPDQCDGNVADLLDNPIITPFIPDDEVHQFNRPPYTIDWPLNWDPFMRHSGLEPRTIDTQYQMLESLGFLDRKAWSWDVPVEAKVSLDKLMEHTHSPDWLESWGRWFEEHKHLTNNLSRMIGYGEVVKHREGSDRKCDGQCSFGCDLKKSPIAPVIEDFLSGDGELHSGNTSDSESEVEPPEDSTTESDSSILSPTESVPLTPVAKFHAHVAMRAHWGLHGPDKLLEEFLPDGDRLGSD